MDAERPIDIHQYTRALRRALPTIAGLAGLATIVTVLVSVIAPKTYEASATILALDTTGLGSADTADAQRRLETVERLAGTTAVMRSAAARLAEITAEELRNTVSVSADPNSNLLTVSVRAPTNTDAATRANIVAEALVEAERRLNVQLAAEARSRVQAEINRLRTIGVGAEAIQAARSRFEEVTAEAVLAATALRILERAEAPVGASSARPIFGGVIAFLAFGLTGMLFVLAREQVAPNPLSNLELGELLGAPMLEEVPQLRARDAIGFAASTPQMRDAFYGIAAAVRSDAIPGTTRVVLVTSARTDDGRASVSAGLGCALAGLGATTLVVCGDLRQPMLHELLQVPRYPGLSDIALTLRELSRAIHLSPEGAGKLHVLPSGSASEDPAQLLLSTGLAAVFADISRRQYDFVLIDAPPAIGFPDVAALAKFCDDIVVVVQSEGLTANEAARLRGRLAKLEARTLGIVVVGSSLFA